MGKIFIFASLLVLIFIASIAECNDEGMKQAMHNSSKNNLKKSRQSIFNLFFFISGNESGPSKFSFSFNKHFIVKYFNLNLI